MVRVVQKPSSVAQCAARQTSPARTHSIPTFPLTTSAFGRAAAVPNVRRMSAAAIPSSIPSPRSSEAASRRIATWSSVCVRPLPIAPASREVPPVSRLRRRQRSLPARSASQLSERIDVYAEVGQKRHDDPGLPTKDRSSGASTALRASGRASSRGTERLSCSRPPRGGSRALGQHTSHIADLGSDPYPASAPSNEYSVRGSKSSQTLFSAKYSGPHGVDSVTSSG
jgi:hypothetical protein